MWREIGGGRFDQFAFVPAVGTAGGIIIGWNSGAQSGRSTYVGKHCLSVDFFSLKGNFN